VFYTLTKIHKPTPVGRPIISGCDGLTERLFAFVDKLLQPIAKEQESYLEDMTYFINVTESIKLKAPTWAALCHLFSVKKSMAKTNKCNATCRSSRQDRFLLLLV